MNIPSNIQQLSSFEIEKLCNLLECDQQELVEFEKHALQIAHETEYTYDAMMKILQKGHNLREAIFIAMIIGRKEGYLQAEADMEEEIKDKLYQAFRGNRNQ
jgi:hypothetical protein